MGALHFVTLNTLGLALTGMPGCLDEVEKAGDN